MRVSGMASPGGAFALPRGAVDISDCISTSTPKLLRCHSRPEKGINAGGNPYGSSKRDDTMDSRLRLSPFRDGNDNNIGLRGLTR